MFVVSGFYAGDHDRAPEADDEEYALLATCAPDQTWRTVVAELENQLALAFDDPDEYRKVADVLGAWADNYAMSAPVAPCLKRCNNFCVAVYITDNRLVI